jgi:hypothetical protein
MSKQAKPTTQIDVLTPALGPVPALYVPIRRAPRATRRNQRAK